MGLLSPMPRLQRLLHRPNVRRSGPAKHSSFRSTDTSFTYHPSNSADIWGVSLHAPTMLGSALSVMIAVAVSNAGRGRSFWATPCGGGHRCPAHRGHRRDHVDHQSLSDDDSSLFLFGYRERVPPVWIAARCAEVNEKLSAGR
jgi:hypothetical protein